MNAKEAPSDGALESYRQGWTTAETWGSAERMNDLEAFMWRSERHPHQSSTITSLMILDQVPDWERLRAAHDWAASLLTAMRRKVLEPVLPVGPPAWVVDPDFNLDYHLRRAHLPAPGGNAELLTFTEGAALAPFDRRRPLWEATLVSGLSGGRAAYILKVHHSLTDGLGLIQLASLMQSPTREHTPKGSPSPPHAAAEGMDRYSLAVSELSDQMFSVPGHTARLVAAQVRLLSKPAETISAGLRYFGSMRRTLSPSCPNSPLFRGRTGKDWRFATMDCSFADLRVAAKAASGSVNDAYIAALLGGLRRYHAHHGLTLDELPMAMPVSIRKADDPMGGNKFAGAMFAAPMGIVDAAERIATVRGIVLSVRVEPAVDSFSALTPVLNRSPSGVGALVMRAGAAADLSASNVPGLPRASYVAGALVERVYGFGPLPGVAVMASMNSQNGTACFGFNIDGSAVPDVPVMVRCMEEGLAEVLALAPHRAATTKKSPSGSRSKTAVKSTAKGATSATKGTTSKPTKGTTSRSTQATGKATTTRGKKPAGKAATRRP